MSIKEKLIDGMRGQAVLLPDPLPTYASGHNGDQKWWRIDEQNLEWIAERLLRTSGIAIMDTAQSTDLIQRLQHFHDGGTVPNPKALIREAIAALFAVAVQAQEEQR